MVNWLMQMMADAGIDIFGTADISRHVPARFAALPFAITIGVRLSNAVMEPVCKGPTKLYFHHYRTANAFLDRCAFQCVVQLQRWGYDAAAIPASQTTHSAAIAGDFPHKTAANLAGLGFIGKSGLFISERFGPRVRLATVLTNAQLPAGTPIAPRCGECNACVAACPCGAIVGHGWTENLSRDDLVDAALCSRYMKDKYADIGRGAVCGICVAVCPFGADSKKTY